VSCLRVLARLQRSDVLRGLGLWLCKHIVTRHDGSIYYENAVGGGAKFVVELRSVV
jgi:signal transduction histidine kinase